MLVWWGGSVLPFSGGVPDLDICAHAKLWDHDILERLCLVENGPTHRILRVFFKENILPASPSCNILYHPLPISFNKFLPSLTWWLAWLLTSTSGRSSLPRALDVMVWANGQMGGAGVPQRFCDNGIFHFFSTQHHVVKPCKAYYKSSPNDPTLSLYHWGLLETLPSGYLT